MKRNSILSICVALLLMATLSSFVQGDKTMTKENGMTIINTKNIGKHIEGYAGTTPLKIYIKKNKVVKVEALPNQETPKFFARAAQIIDSWNGKTVDKALKAQVDGVTGATYSSDAIKENVKVALKYYKEHKR